MPKSRKRRPAGRSSGRPRPSGPSRAAAEAPPSRRRGWIYQAIAIAVIVGLSYLLLFRSKEPGEVSAEALAAADAAGCSDLEQPVEPNPERTHIDPGGSFDYPDPPAASGPHDPQPLPPDPHVYADPVEETRAVHNLEHAYVLVYHDGLSTEAVDALSSFASEQARVIMAPYPDLPEGAGLALVAWNTRWLCPASVSPEQAVAIAEGFVDAFRGTTVAPEAPRGLLGPMLQK